MTFKINDQVVYPAFGVGRVIGLVTKSFSERVEQPYYEVVGERGTVWVQVSEAATAGLRALTRKEELGTYRAVLRGRPVGLNQDARQRQTDFRNLLKRGALQDLCEIVRDLSARGWVKPLGEYDAAGLRKGRDGLCQEWAAADGVSLGQATAEVSGLLREARETFHV